MGTRKEIERDGNGRLKKGANLNPKGRGNVPNKTTQEIREAYQMLVSQNLENMNLWLEQVIIHKGKFIRLYQIRLTKYISALRVKDY